MPQNLLNILSILNHTIMQKVIMCTLGTPMKDSVIKECFTEIKEKLIYPFNDYYASFCQAG